MKRPIKIYLDFEMQRRLLQKAAETGFNGRGALTKFMEKVAVEDVCFLDDNLRKMLKALFPSKAN
jgi:hypothetical protein